MKVVDKAAKHFNDIPMRSITIAEWETDVYFRPITVGDMKWVELRKPKTEYDSNLLLLIRKAKDADGVKMFEPGDKQKLEDETDMSILARLMAFMAEDVPRGKTEPGATAQEVEDAAVGAAKDELSTDPT